MMTTDFEAVIGLEVHAELKTATKIFCSCPTTFGAAPNTLCCPVCLGLPGALPTLNRRAVELAVRAGLALDCKIATLCRTDRKQYFYPDLPKAYQISQDPYPLCFDGGLDVGEGEHALRIGIARIHIEEDAGKLIHTGDKTLVDCNRCGVPLIEIVTRPVLRSPEEAGAFLRALRQILVTCEVSDCRMQEGSLRCDVNVSLRKKGSEELGTRTEIKNINSFAFVEKAIAYEIQRQTELLQSGSVLRAETRRFDASTGKTELMRIKESADDYRYLAEPDLPALALTQEEIDAIAKTLPELPRARAERLTRDCGIAKADAEIFVTDPALGDYFEQAASATTHKTLLSGLILTDLLRHCQSDPFASPVKARRMGEIAEMMGEGRVNSSTAKKLVARLIEGDFDPREAVLAEGLAQIRDRETLVRIVDEVLTESSKAVADYKNGKLAALRALQGRAMAKTKGLADPVLLETILLEKLSN